LEKKNGNAEDVGADEEKKRRTLRLADTILYIHFSPLNFQ
jgi:hypothetical protein